MLGTAELEMAHQVTESFMSWVGSDQVMPDSGLDQVHPSPFKYSKYLKLNVVPDLTISNPAGAGSGFVDNLFFGSQSNTPDETNGVNNAVSCYNEAVQFSSSFMSLFASF